MFFASLYFHYGEQGGQGIATPAHSRGRGNPDFAKLH
jgi:hypothetical protein